jgi:hypothetical protein
VLFLACFSQNSPHGENMSALLSYLSFLYQKAGIKSSFNKIQATMMNDDTLDMRNFV